MISVVCTLMTSSFFSKTVEEHMGHLHVYVSCVSSEHTCNSRTLTE